MYNVSEGCFCACPENITGSLIDGEKSPFLERKIYTVIPNTAAAVGTWELPKVNP